MGGNSPSRFRELLATRAWPLPVGQGRAQTHNNKNECKVLKQNDKCILQGIVVPFQSIAEKE